MPFADEQREKFRGISPAGAGPRRILAEKMFGITSAASDKDVPPLPEGKRLVYVASARDPIRHRSYYVHVLQRRPSLLSFSRGCVCLRPVFFLPLTRWWYCLQVFQREALIMDVITGQPEFGVIQQLRGIAIDMYVFSLNVVHMKEVDRVTTQRQRLWCRVGTVIGGC